ncbi:MAG: HisA/HisF-related TIM barrel protein [Thermoplasmata archaeon]|nr:HisA/HisF-related TIM barrel protein [Thermoplasmata archaeon]
MTNLPASPPAPRLIPALWLGSGGQVMVPSGDRLVAAVDARGRPLDLFETADRLTREHGRIYLHDLEGLRHGKAQLDYIQEIAREAELWVDAGIQDAGDATDIIVAGATRAVLSTERLRGARELSRAWKLTPDVLLEIKQESGALSARGDGWAASPALVAAEARELGVGELLLNYGDGPVDWEGLRRLSEGGPCWVSRGYELSAETQLLRSGAAGAVVDYVFSPEA